jgi:RNase P subunit RPR2
MASPKADDLKPVRARKASRRRRVVKWAYLDKPNPKKMVNQPTSVVAKSPHELRKGVCPVCGYVIPTEVARRLSSYGVTGQVTCPDCGDSIPF